MPPRTRIFISHSSKDDEFAGKVRDGVAEELKNLQFDVLLDRQRLDPGDRWRAKLHRWLGVCDGAVLLFSEGALASDWVRKEATILTWRQEFEREIRLVPAVLGGVQKQALDAYGLGPLKLTDEQIAGLAAAEQAEGSVDSRAALLASRIVKGFDGIAPRSTATPMDKWVRQVATLIRDNDFLEDAAAALFDATDFAVGDDPVDALTAAELAVSAERVAYQILNSDPLAIEHAFEELLQGGLTVEARTRLAKLMIPSWVPAESARAITAAALGEGRPRVVSLRARQAATPEHAVRKATCSDARHEVVEAKSMKGTTEDPEAELARRYRNHVLQTLGVDTRSPTAAQDAARSQSTMETAGKRVFVILGADAIECAVGPALWNDGALDHPVYVLAADDAPVGANELGVTEIVRVEPDVDEGMERDGTTIGARMLNKAETL